LNAHMAQPRSDRRALRRFSLDLPIHIKRLNGDQSDATGHTRDVSSRGVYMLISSELKPGAPIEFVMTLPSEITLADPVRVRCQGRILRVDRDGQEMGAAVAIDHYDFVGE
jgi:1,4-alpha-glucan branching enzyme